MSLIPPKSKFLTKVSKKQQAENLKKMPTAHHLFRRKFAVLVPAAYLYNDEDFARGVPVTGDKERDRKAANELEIAYLPIAPDDDAPEYNILEFFENNIPCNFRYESDVLAVYDILMRHFKEMAQYINDNPLMGKDRRDRLFKDLTRFDALASKLHPNAHSLLPKHLATDSVEARLRQVLQPRMGKSSVVDAIVPATEEMPEYQKFTTGINKNLLKGSKRWQ